MVKKESIQFNHISKELSQVQIIKFKTLYKYYHKLKNCYQWKYQKLRKLKLTLELSSIALTSLGVIIGSITLCPIILGSISGSGILIQSYLTKSDLNKRADRCRFAYTSYDKILIQIKSYLRGLPYNESIFLSDIKVLDETISDLCPGIQKYIIKYDKIFA